MIDLPAVGRFLISGPAGSGKTIMALYRVWTLVMQGRKPVLMTYSRPLKNYCLIAASRLELDSTVMTFHEWFSGYWKKRFNQRPPRGIEEFTFDWSAILLELGRAGHPEVEIEDLVIDEGQDLPHEFYLVSTILAENVTVFADENQRISDSQSTLKEIKSFLGDGTVHHSVSSNSRNTMEIARLAEIFVDENLSLPTRRGKHPELHWYSTTKEIIDRIVKYIKENPGYEVAVTAQHQQTIKGLWMELDRRKVSSAQIYVRNGSAPAKIDFAKRGIKILTSKSMKGLEFDAVFVTDIETYSTDAADHAARMQMYVLTTRAREELHLFYRGSAEPSIVSRIPHTTLRRTL
ncbi:ATP-binding domain-containing protein [Streptosporangium sp. NPDC006930]|uniref:ATP-binding domain-containing protein n=1 Tax=Streptosporangium sp. NPDC006930 TaxID=3154783 RepID=UPI00342FF1C6